ncbi:hypothetical protein, partial [Pseudomonas sp. CGJS7]|uniref:hypothetical protein n=1 Tax=Pseudomonas sp. CGJS7 TaxID=3109348 RepID=UPI003008CE22
GQLRAWAAAVRKRVIHRGIHVGGTAGEAAAIGGETERPAPALAAHSGCGLGGGLRGSVAALPPGPARNIARGHAGNGGRWREVAATTLWKGWIALIAEPHVAPEGAVTVGFAIVPWQCAKTFIADDKRHQRCETRPRGEG